MNCCYDRIAPHWIHATALAALLVTAAPDFPLQAQGLNSQETIDTIVGSDVVEEEVEAADDPQRIIAAIEATPGNISMVRKVSNLDKVDIVFLADSTVAEGGPPAEVNVKIKENEAAIVELRQEIEGNAMLYHAINSRSVLMRDILAIEFDDQNGAVVYVAAKPPAN